MPNPTKQVEEDKDKDANIIDGENFVIELEDDTPEQDRNRKPLNKDVLAEDDDDAAIMQSKTVQKRIGELRHAAHDERRAREAAQRERDEAVRVARLTTDELREARRKLQYGEHNYANATKEKAELALNKAKAEYRAAYDAGDPDALADAAEALSKATHEAQEAGAWVASSQQKAETALQEEKDDVQSAPSRQATSTRQAPQPDEAAVEWVGKNEWYGRDPEMTSLAYGVHEKLVKQGVHPVKDADKYYEEIDKAMRRRFPEYEWSDEDNGSVDDGASTAKPAKATATKTSAVAPVSRSSSSGGTSGNKQRVKLTKTQVALAQKLGITPEQYAVELLKTQGE